MATYVMLAKLTQKGREDIKAIAEHRQQNLEKLAQRGITSVMDFALMGQYDFLYVVEAPDDRTIFEQAIKDSTSGVLEFITMPAMPLDQFEAFVKDNVKD
jgi:uncharacterized protein with GYD domain